MFTGIVEAQGKVLKIEKDKGNLHLFLSCSFLSELRVDQSLSHNGVCLTVCELGTDFYRVTAIPETLEKTNLGELYPGDMVNLERCMPVNGRFDGHIVQGHTDTRGTCIKVEEDQGSWRLWFQHAPEFGQLTVEKGSVCVNGVSLTVVESEKDYFSVAVIPYTWEHTNLSSLEAGRTVNIEFDVLGKYIRKMLQPVQNAD
jgi:riboflavin synthase